MGDVPKTSITLRGDSLKAGNILMGDTLKTPSNTPVGDIHKATSSTLAEGILRMSSTKPRATLKIVWESL
jgi:hypothetical protein